MDKVNYNSLSSVAEGFNYCYGNIYSNCTDRYLCLDFSFAVVLEWEFGNKI